ncbi:hypothetical protein WN943_027537 [Citrus x changshan-huyou]
MKNISISGELKKVTGDLFDEKFDEVTLFFIGAGGQHNLSGILNLLAFGVAQPSPLLVLNELIILGPQDETSIDDDCCSSEQFSLLVELTSIMNASCV